jgi:hypothetical protein
MTLMDEHNVTNGEGPTEELTGGGVAQCGTSTTPPCPLYELLAERSALIYQLAGCRDDRERIAQVAREVDAYLLSAVRSAARLSRSAHGHTRVTVLEVVEER